MAVEIFANNATTTLAAPLSAGSTTCTVATGTGSLFPTPGAGQYFALSFLDAATSLVREIVYVTNRTGDTMTITRGQEGTTATTWLSGDFASNNWTAGSAAIMVQVAQLQIQATNYGTAGGTANAITMSLTPAPASYSSITGSPIRIKITNANTGAATVNLNSLGAVSIINTDGTALNSGQMPTGAIVTLIYNGASFELVAPSHWQLLGRANTWTQNQTFSGTVTVSGTVSGLGTINAVTSISVGNNSTQGTVALIPGDTTHPGYVEYISDGGARAGFSGFNDSTTYLALQADSPYTGWKVLQNFAVNGSSLFNGAVQVNGILGTNGITNTGDIGTSGGAVFTGVTTGAGTAAIWANTTNTAANMIAFEYNSVQVGNISTDGTNTIYATTSDKDLKIDDGALTGSGKIIDGLKPKWFRWKNKADAPSEPGFFAQDTYKVYKWAVKRGGVWRMIKNSISGEKVKTYIPWTMDSSKMMPVVIAELQELRKRVATLEAK